MKKLTQEHIEVILHFVMKSTGKNTVDDAVKYLDTTNQWDDLLDMFQDRRYVVADSRWPTTKSGLLAALKRQNNHLTDHRIVLL